MTLSNGIAQQSEFYFDNYLLFQGIICFLSVQAQSY